MAGVAVLMMAPVPCAGVGLYEDLGRLSFFLRSPRERAVDGSLAFTEIDNSEAAVFTMGIQHPVRGSFLLQGDLSFATRRFADSVNSGSGDFRLRSRGTLWTGAGRSVSFIAGFRLGVGELGIFPYASSSFDVEVGLSYVDTLASLTWWATTGGVVVAQVDADLKEDGLYGNYAQAGGGLVLSLPGRLDAQAGALGYGFPEGGERVVVFSDLDFKYSKSLAANALFQVEAGREAVRVYDYAIVFSVRAAY